MRDQSSQQTAEDGQDWRPLLRQWPIGLLITLVAFASACLVVSALTPRYKAYVQLLLPLKLVEDPDHLKPAAPQQADTLVVKSFTDLLTDDGIARTVIRNLDLAKKSEFQPQPNFFTDAVAAITRYAAGGDDDNAIFSSKELHDDSVLQLYKSKLQAVSESKDLTITLSFEAYDPHLAEKIVSAHAHAFVEGEIEHRRRDYGLKVGWMKSELDRSAAEARDAQVAVQLNPTALTVSRAMSASAASDLKMRQLEATGTQAVFEGVLKRYQDTISDQLYDGSEIRIVSDATLPTHPYFPKKLLLVAVSALLSGMLGIFGALIASVVRKRVDVVDLAEAMKLPVLAHINVPRALWSWNNPRARLTRTLFWQRVHEVRSTIQVTAKRHPITLVTSALPKEGKSLVASALARSLANSGQKTLLVDLNARNGRYRASVDRRLHTLPTLQDFLDGSATVGQVSVRVDNTAPLFLMKNPEAKAVDLAGLSGAQLRTRLAALKKEYDAIVVDAPALESLSDAIQIAAFTDEIVIAVHAGNTRWKELEDNVAKIRARSPNLKGMVIVSSAPPERGDLAHVAGYSLQDVQRDVWPRARSRRAFNFGWLRRAFGRTVDRDGRAEATV